MRKNKELPVKKNENYIMQIIDIGTVGEGIGKVNGYTIFVEGAVLGDIVEIKVVKLGNSFGYGKLLNIVTPSNDRIEPRCKYFSHCGGCQVQQYSYMSQLEFKRKKVQDNIERIGGLTGVEVLPTLGMENPWNYRNKAQFPVRIKNEEIKIGFYAPRSHNIIELETCHIQHKINDEIIKIVKNFMQDFNIVPYDEITYKGTVRHILTRVGFVTGEIMVCVVINGKKLPYIQQLVEKLKTIKGMTSIVLNFNNDRNNVILGNKIETVWGRGYITDYIGNVKFEISPNSFYQVNPVQTKVMYDTAMEYAGLTGKEIVFDAYCGIGTISLFLAQKAKKVYGVEIVENAIEDARRNADINHITNADFFVGKSEEVIPRLYKENGIKADVIVVDPPRKGCDEALLNTVLDMLPNRIVYVSCDSATMARDLKILCADGKYVVGKVQPVDNFCQTSHVETVCLLTRKAQ